MAEPPPGNASKCSRSQSSHRHTQTREHDTHDGMGQTTQFYACGTYHHKLGGELCARPPATHTEQTDSGIGGPDTLHRATRKGATSQRRARKQRGAGPRPMGEGAGRSGEGRRCREGGVGSSAHTHHEVPELPDETCEGPMGTRNGHRPPRPRIERDGVRRLPERARGLSWSREGFWRGRRQLCCPRPPGSVCGSACRS